MDYRHEVKIEINALDLIVLRQRLRAVAHTDPHAIHGRYVVRSLYFDTLDDRALREKIDGVNEREKFRIRMYNGDTGMIRLEKKSKKNGLGNKQSARMTKEQIEWLLDGELSWMVHSEEVLIRELYVKMQQEGLRPKTIVEYTREPYIYGPGNVRVTFDHHIRTGLFSTDYLNLEAITIPAGDETILMEVKWDAFLPDVIRDAVGLRGRRSAAFSKYAQCRIYM